MSRLTVSVADIAVPIEVIVPVSEEKRIHVFPNGVVVIVSGVTVFIVVVGVVESAVDVIGVFVVVVVIVVVVVVVIIVVVVIGIYCVMPAG